MSKQKERTNKAINFGWWCGRIDQMSEDLAYIEETQDYLYDLIKKTEDKKERNMYISKMFHTDFMRYKMSKAFHDVLKRMQEKYPKFEYTDGEPCVMATLITMEGDKILMKDRREVVKTIKEALGDKANRSGYIMGNSKESD